MNIGLVDVDGHNFPNFALMRLSAYNKAKGHRVEWASPAQRYDKVLASKVFTFTPDYDYNLLDAGEVIGGGTGYDIAGRLPEAVENNDKILMTAKDNSGSLYSAGWDLIPSTYKGYFSIQSESYLGQSDPNNSWSVFYHVLEAKANNKLGYAQRVNYRAQQEFLITPTASFTLQNVTFDLENATISNGAVISKVTSLTNVHEYTTNENLTINFNAEETSNFYETAGTLKVNISSPSSIKFPRPRPIAGKAVLMGDESKDAIYSSATQKLSAPVEYSTSIEMKPRCLLQLTTKFKTFILNVPYVAVAKYGDREIKVRGTWRGYSVADPELNKPINEPHYFDLETGEELNYSLSFDPERKIYVTK